MSPRQLAAVFGAGIFVGILVNAAAGTNALALPERLQLALLGLATGLIAGLGGAGIGAWSANRVAEQNRRDAKDAREQELAESRAAREAERADTREARFLDRRLDLYGKVLAFSDEWYMVAVAIRPAGPGAPPHLKRRFESGEIMSGFTSAVAQVRLIAPRSMAPLITAYEGAVITLLNEAREATDERWAELAGSLATARHGFMEAAVADLGRDGAAQG